MMKFQVLLLAFAVMVATNIHCQGAAQSQLEDADKSPVVKGHVVSKGPVWMCNCSGIHDKKQKDLCQKKRIKMNKKCQQLTGGNRKEKKVRKVFSMPI